MLYKDLANDDVHELGGKQPQIERNIREHCNVCTVIFKIGWNSRCAQPDFTSSENLIEISTKINYLVFTVKQKRQEKRECVEWNCKWSKCYCLSQNIDKLYPFEGTHVLPDSLTPIAIRSISLRLLMFQRSVLRYNTCVSSYFWLRHLLLKLGSTTLKLLHRFSERRGRESMIRKMALLSCRKKEERKGEHRTSVASYQDFLLRVSKKESDFLLKLKWIFDV